MNIGAQDIAGVVGIVPTPATGDAEHWQSRNTVNLAETAKMIDIVVDGGVDVVMTTGTFGECATLTAAELRDFVDCVVQTTAKRRPVFAGITTLNTRDTIERGRELLALGADGLFVGRPMWLPLDDAGIVRFYRDIAEGFAGVPLVIYDNPFAFKGKISTDVYGELAKIPEYVASKHVGGPALKTDMAAGRRSSHYFAARHRLVRDRRRVAGPCPGLLVGCGGVCTGADRRARGTYRGARLGSSEETLG